MTEQKEIKQTIQAVVEPKKGGLLKVLGALTVGAVAVLAAAQAFYKGKKAKNQPEVVEEAEVVEE